MVENLTTFMSECAAELCDSFACLCSGGGDGETLAWLPVVIAGMSAASSIFGGIAKSREASEAAKRQEQMIAQQKAESTARYNRIMNEDGTQRADVRRALTQASDRLMRQNRAVAGKAAVVGGSNAEVAAQKEASAMAYGDAVSKAAAAAESRRDAAENAHAQEQRSIAQQEMTLEGQRSAANQAAIDTAVGGVGAIASSFIAANSGKAGKTPAATGDNNENKKP